MIYTRSALRSLVKTFLLFLAAFIFVYVLVDGSTHAKALNNLSLSFGDIALYYFCQLANQAELLFPLALATSSIKVLIDARLSNETLALAAAGMPLKRITRPHFLFALICCLLLYINFQFILPHSTSYIQNFERVYFREGNESKLLTKVHALPLENESLLLYPEINPASSHFEDVYYLKTFDHLYHIGSLTKEGQATDVRQLLRSRDGLLKQTALYDSHFFPELLLSERTFYLATHPPQMQSMTNLAHQLILSGQLFSIESMSDRDAESASLFYFRLLFPLAAFLAVAGPAPYILRFSRRFSAFLLYACSLFGLLAFSTMMQAGLIIGESQLLPPLLALTLPLVPFLLFVGWKFQKV